MEVEIIDGLDQIEVMNTPLDDIESELVNLINVVTDETGSMHIFRQDMLQCLGDFKQALMDSKEEDSILVARSNFSGYKGDIVIGGYKRIADFDVSYNANGMTPLYDVIIEAANRLTNDASTGYMDFLKQNGTRVKAVFAVFSDGDDTSSVATLAEAKAAVEHLNNLEIVTAFIGFGNEAKGLAKSLGFRNTLEVGASASELRRAFNTLSKSVIESSKSVVSSQDGFFNF